MVELSWFICGAAAISTVLILRGTYKLKKQASVETPPHSCPNNLHNFVAIDAQPLRMEGAAYVQTLLLKRCCRCGLHVSWAYAGSWTLGDFMKKECDLAALERMAQ